MTAEAIAGLLDGPFGYSRALAPGLQDSLRALPGSQQLPFVRGRVVVPEDFVSTVVVGFPNYFGVFEDQQVANAVYVTGRWTRLRILPENARSVGLDPSAEPHLAAELLESGRLLAKRLRQLAGVQIAIRPQSPILTLLVPRVNEIAGEIPGVKLLGRRYPELPGGIRIELPPDARGAELSRYAASVEETISQEA
ncbi:MAG: hypothetical protein WCC01_13450 [Acidimicrobiia bacterium]